MKGDVAATSSVGMGFRLIEYAASMYLRDYREKLTESFHLL